MEHRPLRTLALALALALAPTALAHAAPAPDADARYQALLAAAKADPAGADWGALRIAFAERPGFNVFGGSDARNKMFLALQKNDCGAALPAAHAALEAAFVDVDAHLVAAFCEDQAGQADAAKLDRQIGVGLARSIATGDGLTPATAFTPIDVEEEYALMRVMGQKVTAQALVNNGGHAYDLLSTEGKDGKPGKFYFLIDRVLAAESAALKPGTVSEGGPP